MGNNWIKILDRAKPKALRVAVFILTAISVAGPLLAQDLVINEIMSSNQTTIADENGDFSDWVELLNSGQTSINLRGYGLSDSFNNPFKWVFPEVVIAPGQFMLVWASNKNRINPTAPLHTNFAFSASGEELILTQPNGTRIFELPPRPMGADISFGHQPDASGNLFFSAHQHQGHQTPPRLIWAYLQLQC